MPSNHISPRAVLAQLTRSGIWSTWTSSWARRGGHVVLDADSIASHLYHHCTTTSTSRTPSGGCNNNNLVNYREFARLIGQVLDHLQNGLQLTPVLVYGGVHKWPGLHAAHLLMMAGNNQQAAAAGSAELAKLPNLALQIFKLVASGRQVKVHQAAYGSYPTLVKLARDLRCPVLTNEGDFILMDVRAGFVLFEDYFRSYLDHQGAGGPSYSPLARFPSSASTSSAASSASGGRPSRSKLSSSSSGGPKSATAATPSGRDQRRPTSASSTGSTRSSKGALPSPAAPQQVKLRLHTHRLFLRQHPGLDHALALKMMPFTSCEFLAQHAKSLASIRVMTGDLLSLGPEAESPKDHKKTTTGKCYHLAAARLESVMRFLCARTGDILPFLIHGEVARLNSSRFEDDYTALHDHYAVAHDLRGHLRVLMEARGSKLDAAQLTHVQRALVERECTADFWLSLACGPTAASTNDPGRSLHFEDTKTLHSARVLLDRPKSLALSVLVGGGGKRNSPIKILDRQGQKLVERTLSLSGALKKQQEQQQQGRGAVTLAQVARKTLSRQEAAAFVNLAFNSRDLTKLDSTKLEQLLAEWVPFEAKNLHKSNTGGAKNSPKSPVSPVSPSQSSATQSQHSGQQLAVLLGLHKFSLEQAAEGDQHFKTHYLRLGQHFEIGLVNHYAYTSYLQLIEAAQRATKGTAAASNQEFHRDALEHNLHHLIELINKRDLETAVCSGFNETQDKQQNKPAGSVSPSSPRGPRSASSQRSRVLSPASVEGSTGGAGGGHAQGELRKQIKHLIELFNATLEAYCELNAFLNYPLPRLQLHTSYNSILLYNLILFSCQEPINTRLVKF